MPKYLLLFLLSFSSVLSALAGRGDELQSVSVAFYSERINISYDPDLVLSYAPAISEKGLVDYYNQLARRGFQPLLRELEQYRSAFQLNDWLYYELICTAVQQIMPGRSPVQQELTSWFLLTQSGFDTRLTFREGKVYTNVYTNEEVFQAPLIQDRGRTFVNLTSIRKPEGGRQQAIFLLNFAPRTGARSFSFALNQVPRLQPQLNSRSLRFGFGDYVYQLDVNVDQTIIAIMKQYPFIAEKQYLETPLSPGVAASLLPQLRQMIKGKTEREALEFLVAFTRSSFSYKDDKEYFGFSKPMIADEVLHYPYSDCEDRVALFYRLVRELLELPMVIVAYEDHLTVGVSTTQPCGDAVTYHGRAYYICDPTGPANSTAIGRFPRGYESRPFEIIGQYR